MKEALLVFIISIYTQLSFGQSADLILWKGNIITLQSNGHRAEAIAIKGDTIVTTGTNEEIKKYISTNTKVIDLEGKTVIPGFNDVHQHPFPIYEWNKPYAELRLDTISSMKSLISLIKRKALITPKGILIKGVGYNELKLGGQPIRDSLDLATTEHPVLIVHASGHLVAVNSLMLKLNSITKKTQDPPGGSFERYHDGIPDGIVKESARKEFKSTNIIEAQTPSHEEQLEGYRKYFSQMLSGGLTSIGDCGVSPEKLIIYHELVAENFPFRFNLYIGVDYLDQVISDKIKKEASPYLRVAGIKMFHGNSLSGKTCWLSDPYDLINPITNKKDYYGIPPARSQESLDSLVLRIHSAGLQIACHSNGDREIEMLINAVEKAQIAFPIMNMRHRIEHCSVTNQSILDRIKIAQLIPVFHCYINELGGQLAVYGSKRLSMMMPTKSALDMHIPFALHSDFPISRYEAMIRLGSAVNRKTIDGTVLGANQRLEVEEAIKAYTINGAYTSHEENVKGSIKTGQYADLVILDKDPVKIEKDKINSIEILTTIVGGKIAYQKSKN